MAKVEVCLMYLVAISVAADLNSTSSEAMSVRHRHNIMSGQHLERVNNFTCAHPQRRLVQLTELGVEVSPGNSYYPSATVLRRCDCSTGYCNNPEDSCTSSRNETVELVFRVKNQVNKTSHHYISVNATDHISCSCQPRHNQIK